MFEVSILIIFCEKYDYHSWLKYNFEDADIVTTTAFLTGGCNWSHNHVEEQWLATQLWHHWGVLSGGWAGCGGGGCGDGWDDVGDVPRSRHTSSKHCFNRNGWVWS